MPPWLPGDVVSFPTEKPDRHADPTPGATPTRVPQKGAPLPHARVCIQASVQTRQEARVWIAACTLRRTVQRVPELRLHQDALPSSPLFCQSHTRFKITTQICTVFLFYSFLKVLFPSQTFPGTGRRVRVEHGLCGHPSPRSHLATFPGGHPRCCTEAPRGGTQTG